MRNLRRSATVLGAVLITLTTAVPPAAAGTATLGYRLLDLGTLGGESSYASAMNDRGAVVGSSQVADGSFHGFRWQRGRLTDLGQLRPVDINNRGQIVGTVDVANGWRAVLWTRGRSVDLGTLGGAWASPVAVNDRGQVVGVSDTAQGSTRPFLWTRGRMRELPLDSVAGINNGGRVAGGAVRGGGFHASTWQRGRITDLGALAFDRSNSYGINERGWVIGWGYSDQQAERGLLWRGGRMTDIGTLGGDRTHLVALNDRGELLGVSTDASGSPRPVLWRQGRFTDLTAHGVDAAADLVSLNDRGDIAVSIRPEWGIAHAAVYRRAR